MEQTYERRMNNVQKYSLRRLLALFDDNSNRSPRDGELVDLTLGVLSGKTLISYDAANALILRWWIFGFRITDTNYPHPQDPTGRPNLQKDPKLW